MQMTDISHSRWWHCTATHHARRDKLVGADRKMHILKGEQMTTRYAPHETWFRTLDSQAVPHIHIHGETVLKLSRRETDVLTELVRRGGGDKAIADAFGISSLTVKVYFCRLRAKLAAYTGDPPMNRTQLALWAERDGRFAIPIPPAL
jgi:DNA-binding NarL/FixJ family response regulator